MKIEKEQSNKSFSVNKYIRNASHSQSKYKSDNKIKKTYSKINNLKPNENCPMSCKNKGSSKVRKFSNKSKENNYKYNTFYQKKFKKSNSTLNIIIVPK